jgi:hypothetical protein
LDLIMEFFGTEALSSYSGYVSHPYKLV